MAAQPDQLDFIVADLDLFTRGEIIALTINVQACLADNPPQGTPIDTGWASANWVPSLGEPYDSGPDIKEPTLADVSKRAAVQAQGVNDVLSWNGDGVLFVTNNVPYIQPLNDGHSKQSPPGFVQAAIGRAINMTESAGVNKSQRLQRAATARAAASKPVRFTRAEAFNRARQARKKS